MTIKKTLTSTVLAGVLALGGVGCDIKLNEKYTPTNEPVSAYTKQQYQTKKISGEIVDIDEDSFPVHTGRDWGGGCNFEFENIRIRCDDGKIYKLINAGPTSYRIGDKIQDLNFEQLPNGKISYRDLGRPMWKDSYNTTRFIRQSGSIEADGILK